MRERELARRFGNLSVNHGWLGWSDWSGDNIEVFSLAVSIIVQSCMASGSFSKFNIV